MFDGKTVLTPPKIWVVLKSTAAKGDRLSFWDLYDWNPAGGNSLLISRIGWVLREDLGGCFSLKNRSDRGSTDFFI